MDLCGWGTLINRDQPPCFLTARKDGLCRIHYKQKYRKIIYTKCRISSCDKEQNHGDQMCEEHGILNGRGKCVECDAPSTTLRCRECRGVKTTPCCKTNCKLNGTKEFFGRNYCHDHYPERKLCCFVTREVQCSKKWHSDADGGDQINFCRDHGGVRLVNRKQLKYRGRCQKMVPLAVPRRCKSIPGKSGLCKRHDHSKKCRLCDKPALVGFQQLCESHVQKGDAFWCPVCKKGITHRYLKCC